MKRKMPCPNCQHSTEGEPSLFQSNCGAKMRPARSYRCPECGHEWMTNMKGTQIMTINEGIQEVQL